MKVPERLIPRYTNIAAQLRWLVSSYPFGRHETGLSDGTGRFGYILRREKEAWNGRQVYYSDPGLIDKFVSHSVFSLVTLFFL